MKWSISRQKTAIKVSRQHSSLVQIVPICTEVPKIEIERNVFERRGNLWFPQHKTREYFVFFSSNFGLNLLISYFQIDCIQMLQLWRICWSHSGRLQARSATKKMPPLQECGSLNCRLSNENRKQWFISSRKIKWSNVFCFFFQFLPYRQRWKAKKQEARRNRKNVATTTTKPSGVSCINAKLRIKCVSIISGVTFSPNRPQYEIGSIRIIFVIPTRTICGNNFSFKCRIYCSCGVCPRKIMFNLI